MCHIFNYNSYMIPGLRDVKQDILGRNISKINDVEQIYV